VAQRPVEGRLLLLGGPRRLGQAAPVEEHGEVPDGLVVPGGEALLEDAAENLQLPALGIGMV